MDRYGETLVDLLLARVCAITALIELALAVALLATGDAVDAGVLGVLAIATTLTAAGALLLASAGVGQNGPFADVGAVLTMTSALLWLVVFVLDTTLLVGLTWPLELLAAIALLTLAGVAVRVRYRPRFFSARQLGTLMQVADAVIDGGGREVTSSIQVAINTDHIVARMHSPSRKDFQRVLVLVEYAVPLLTVFRPLPFSLMGTHERQRSIERVIRRRGIFRLVARTLKLLSMIGYYGAESTFASVGYVPFEERALDDTQKAQDPLQHPLPDRTAR